LIIPRPRKHNLGGDWARGQKINIGIYFIIVIARPEPSEIWGHRGRCRGLCKLLPHVVHLLLWLICWHWWMHANGRHHGSKVWGRHGLLPCCREGWALHRCTGNRWGTARGRGQDGCMHSCHQSAHGVGVGCMGVVHWARLGARGAGVAVVNVTPVRVVVTPILVTFVWGWWAQGSPHSVRWLLLGLIAGSAPAVSPVAS
jgi:hypothetical protein